MAELAASHKQLRWRIYDAWRIFNTVHVPNLPPRAQEIYAEIEATITTMKDGGNRYAADQELALETDLDRKRTRRFSGRTSGALSTAAE